MFDVNRLVSLGRVTSVAPSPDASWVAVAVQRHDPIRAKYVSELWRIPVDEGTPTRLTRGSSDDRAPSFRHDGALGFLSDRPLDPRKDADPKRAQVWLIPADGGEPRPLTDEPLGVRAFKFARDAAVLVALCDTTPGTEPSAVRDAEKERSEKGPSVLVYDRTPVRFWDHWRGPVVPHLLAFDGEGQNRRDLTPDAIDELRGDVEFDVSGDGRHAAVTRATPGPDRIHAIALWLIGIADGERVTLGGHPRGAVGHPVFSRDGRRIAVALHFRVDGRFGGEELGTFDVETGAYKRLHRGTAALASQAWTGAGAVLFTTDDEGTVPVMRVDGRGQVGRITSVGAQGSHGGLSVMSDGRIVGIRHRIHHPPEAFVVDARADSTPRLISSLSGFTEADGKQIASTQTLSVFADDGERIDAIVVAPPGRAQCPTLLWIHGGPIGQFADGWHWRWNPLVPAAQGYVVALANPRGSTGRGLPFLEGVWGNTWGDRCYRDLMSITDDLEKHPRVDPARIGAMGGSFGGYMVNWIGGNTHRFKCLVSHAGIFDLSGFTGGTDHGAWWTFQMGERPYGREEKFDRWSPHRRIGDWKTPTLVVHGEKDYRCPVHEGLALFEALQAHGVTSRLVIFPDEGHWIQKPRNIVAWYEEVLGFVGRHLARGARS